MNATDEIELADKPVEQDGETLTTTERYDETGEPIFDNWTDRELAVYNAQTIYQAASAIAGVQKEVTPMMERFRKGGILGMMKGF